jgi:hypothetical protein
MDKVIFLQERVEVLEEENSKLRSERDSLLYKWTRLVMFIEGMRLATDDSIKLIAERLLAQIDVFEDDKY